jgi:hypothetical protein
MLTFYGSEVELFVEQVLTRDNGPSLCCARDWTACQWLIVRVDEDRDHLAWLCVPVSAQTMQAVVSGRAAPRYALQHSATGTVELVVVDHGAALPDRRLKCADIPKELLPTADLPTLSAA